mmetsp:Transcript_12510/g.45621  ORF Transcript_12510/g.45621 Transcript_12510/m.45621 type:complete len:316 (-) Transcript_12510:393-1340(-)
MAPRVGVVRSLVAVPDEAGELTQQGPGGVERRLFPLGALGEALAAAARGLELVAVARLLERELTLELQLRGGEQLVVDEGLVHHEAEVGGVLGVAQHHPPHQEVHEVPRRCLHLAPPLPRDLLAPRLASAFSVACGTRGGAVRHRYSVLLLVGVVLGVVVEAAVRLIRLDDVQLAHVQVAQRGVGQLRKVHVFAMCVHQLVQGRAHRLQRRARPREERTGEQQQRDAAQQPAHVKARVALRLHVGVRRRVHAADRLAFRQRLPLRRHRLGVQRRALRVHADAVPRVVAFIAAGLAMGAPGLAFALGSSLAFAPPL